MRLRSSLGLTKMAATSRYPSKGPKHLMCRLCMSMTTTTTASTRVHYTCSNPPRTVNNNIPKFTPQRVIGLLVPCSTRTAMIVVVEGGGRTEFKGQRSDAPADPQHTAGGLRACVCVCVCVCGGGVNRSDGDNNGIGLQSDAIHQIKR